MNASQEFIKRGKNNIPCKEVLFVTTLTKIAMFEIYTMCIININLKRKKSVYNSILCNLFFM